MTKEQLKKHLEVNGYTGRDIELVLRGYEYGKEAVLLHIEGELMKVSRELKEKLK